MLIFILLLHAEPLEQGAYSNQTYLALNFAVDVLLFNNEGSKK